MRSLASLLLVLAVCSGSSSSVLAQSQGTGTLIANKISELFVGSNEGRMVISAIGDGTQCLDAGDWPKEGCNFSLSPWCQSTGVLVYPTCTSAPWTFFNYNGKLWFNTGLRRLGRDYCVQAWDCRNSTESSSPCQVRGAPCEWGGSQYNLYFSVDPQGGQKNGFSLFRIHFANKGDGWCLTNVKAGEQAQLKPCDGSESQLWFVPQW